MCDFLGVDVPDVPFPKTNSSKEFVEEEWKQEQARAILTYETGAVITRQLFSADLGVAVPRAAAFDASGAGSGTLHHGWHVTRARPLLAASRRGGPPPPGPGGR